jgi:hypothetical protein
MKIIGLTGYGYTGKDSVGLVLIRRGWHRIAFADNVRALALEANPIIGASGVGRPIRLADEVEAEGWDEAKKSPEVRRTLQAIGTGVRKVLGETSWIEAAMRDLDIPGLDLLWEEGSAGVVVTDIRHPNEAEAIRSRGGKIVRVHRPGVGPINGHETEAGPDLIAADWSIVNEGTLADLDRAVDSTLGYFWAV